jgi:hypothetical protein
MKRPWQKTDRASGNVTLEGSDNYTPLTLHELAKPGAQKRVVNPKPSQTSKLTPAKVEPRVKPTVRNRGPGSRLKSKRIGRS